jgi:hypothetical protein
MTTINQNRTRMNAVLDPSSILQTAFGFWHSKVLLTAVEFGVFTKLAGRRLTGASLARNCNSTRAPLPTFLMLSWR